LGRLVFDGREAIGLTAAGQQSAGPAAVADTGADAEARVQCDRALRERGARLDLRVQIHLAAPDARDERRRGVEPRVRVRRIDVAQARRAPRHAAVADALIGERTDVVL